jgi:Flp pilus assembly protein TadD
MCTLRKVSFVVSGLLLLEPIGWAQSSSDCTVPPDAKQIEARLDEAKQYRLSGKNDAALNLIEPILARNPKYFRALYTKGLVFADEGKLEESESILQEAVNVQNRCASTQQFKTDYTVYNTLGWVQLSRGKLQKAEESLKLALAHASELTPASVARTKSNLGYLYFINGDFEAAREPLQEAAAAGNTRAVSTLKAVDQAKKLYETSRDRR